MFERLNHFSFEGAWGSIGTLFQIIHKWHEVLLLCPCISFLTLFFCIFLEAAGVFIARHMAWVRLESFSFVPYPVEFLGMLLYLLESFSQTSITRNLTLALLGGNATFFEVVGWPRL